MTATGIRPDGPLTEWAGGDSRAAERAEPGLERTARASRPLVVVFVGGIAGVGKSTIAKSCRLLAASLGYTLYSHYDVNDAFRSKSGLQQGWALVRSPLLWPLLHLTLQSPPLRRRQNEPFLAHRWRCVAEMRKPFVLLYEFARRYPNAVVILDQWMCRKLDVRDEQHVAAVFSFLERSDAYFDKWYLFVNVPVEISAERAWQRAWRIEAGQERGKRSDYHLDKDATYQNYAEKHVLYDRLYSLFEMRGLKVFKLDGERPPEETAALIIRQIVEPYLTRSQGCVPDPRVGPGYPGPTASRDGSAVTGG